MQFLATLSTQLFHHGWWSVPAAGTKCGTGLRAPCRFWGGGSGAAGWRAPATAASSCARTMSNDVGHASAIRSGRKPNRCDSSPHSSETPMTTRSNSPADRAAPRRPAMRPRRRRNFDAAAPGAGRRTRGRLPRRVRICRAVRAGGDDVQHCDGRLGVRAPGASASSSASRSCAAAEVGDEDPPGAAGTRGRRRCATSVRAAVSTRWTVPPRIARPKTGLWKPISTRFAALRRGRRGRCRPATSRVTKRDRLDRDLVRLRRGPAAVAARRRASSAATTSPRADAAAVGVAFDRAARCTARSPAPRRPAR